MHTPISRPDAPHATVHYRLSPTGVCSKCSPSSCEIVHSGGKDVCLVVGIKPSRKLLWALAFPITPCSDSSCTRCRQPTGTHTTP